MCSQATHAGPSALIVTPDLAELRLIGAPHRAVSFHGTVLRHGCALRVALRTLGAMLWSEAAWDTCEDVAMRVPDPFVTVHPDKLWFEVFSQDLSMYGALSVDKQIFTTQGATQFGTTQFEFAAWLWSALAQMRTSRQTALRVQPQAAQPAGGQRLAQKVPIAAAWIRSLLQVQAAMALPGIGIGIRPVDLLATIRFLRFNRAKNHPRALRYELGLGQSARLVIEPWEHVVTLADASHDGSQPCAIRTWGRKRLQMIEALLPFAERVELSLPGRTLPSFYSVKLPGMTFVLGLTGLTNAAGGAGALELGLPPRSHPHTPAVLAALGSAVHASTAEVAALAGLDVASTEVALRVLCYSGRALFDLESRQWRHRELFNPPLDVTKFHPSDSRREQALALLADGVQAIEAMTEEERKPRRYTHPATGDAMERTVVSRQWRIRGACDGQQPMIIVSDDERIVFGQCECVFFKNHLMNLGPCAHMLALLEASAGTRAAGLT